MNDDELMTTLAEAVAEETAVSDRRREAARAAFTWRTVDAELLTLLHDSALEAGAAVRSGADESRALAFGSGGTTLELEIASGQVLGQLVPAQEATVTLQRVGAEDRMGLVDSAGFFRWPDVGAGLVRFAVTVEGRSFTTSWITV